MLGFNKENNSQVIPSIGLPDDLFEESISPWRFSLIGRLNLQQTKFVDAAVILRQQWKLTGDCKLIPLGRGFFTIKLDSETDRQYIKEVKWEVLNQILQIRKWISNFRPKSQKNSKAMVWVRLPGLGLEFWSEKILFKICKKIGTPIKLDEATAKFEVGYYANVLVEVDFANTIPNKVWIDTKYGECRVEKNKLQQASNAQVNNTSKSTSTPVQHQIPKTNYAHITFDICDRSEIEKNIANIEKRQSTQSLKEDAVVSNIVTPINFQVASSLASANINSGRFNALNQEELKEDDVISVDEEILAEMEPQKQIHITEDTEVDSIVKFGNAVSNITYTKGKHKNQNMEVGKTDQVSGVVNLLNIDEANSLQNSTVNFVNGSNGKVNNEAVKITSWAKVVEKETSTSSSVSPRKNVKVVKQVPVSNKFNFRKNQGIERMIIHNSTSNNKGNIWIFWNKNLTQPTVISMSSQMVTVGVGDFNAILSPDEKMDGRSPNRNSMLEFSDCLNKCELLQAPKTGMQFSYSNCQQGKKRILCTLDRVVFNQKWLQIYGDWGYKVGLRFVSDHSPLLGGCASIPKPNNVPRKFQKMWISHPEFLSVVKESWSNVIVGDPAFIFMQKIKELKRVLNDWNWRVFGNVHVKLKEAEEKVLEAMKVSDNNPYDSEALDELVKAQNEHANKEFEAQSVNIKEELLEVVPQLITEEDQSFLDAIPSAEEIKAIVFDMDPESAPGPDGFSGIFYRSCWEIIQDDLLAAIQGGNVGLKLDISQAYGSVSWEFLMKVLMKYGFSSSWCDWLITLFQSARISVMVNGGPCGFFPVSRGLRQGDPLSPILLVLMEDVLSRNISNMISNGKIQPMVVKNGIHPTHLFFADDVFIFCNGSKRSLENLLTLLDDYKVSSGKNINKNKSKCFVDGASTARKQRKSEIVNMELSYFPDKYLGVILAPGRITSAMVWPMVEQIQRKLAA
ncbi:uncharacterized protein LOC113312440 [Papaver somniferum]|uniref:uncharacterized protein LOC113312440 n=1 Tax=Papaver somniferum TaxID=3469 RepID=UPI000E701781|nr:uncharacterized protein LOC113312440 [Papaver somniferum]